jgi:hypothetical protein
MLFGYPVAASAENWLHECLLSIVEAVHINVGEGKKFPSDWSLLLPKAHREMLAKRHGLKRRLAEYHKSLKAISEEQRAMVLDAVAAQNQLAALFDGDGDCRRLDELPVEVHAAVRGLVDFAFDLLTELNIRQRQYRQVWAGIPAKMCAFCGCEYFDAPGAPQEDLDHYLPRSKYPFAAANLRNLPPIGPKCNSAYKRAVDPLHRADGSRRRAFDPYAAAGLSVSLGRTQIDEHGHGPLVAEWVIDFTPESEQAQTWDEIFHIRERFKRDVLDVCAFSDWLKEFGAHCRIPRVQAGLRGDGDLLDALNDYRQYIADHGFKDRLFLKAAFLELVLTRCRAGSERLMRILRDAAGMDQAVVEL